MEVGIIGLGYVGLPLSMVISSAGFKVIGFDVNVEVCDNLNSGHSHIKDIKSELLQSSISNKLFVATSDFSQLGHCDIVIVCVPTPLNKLKDPDLGSVISATEEISKYLADGQLIILESTTYPGTTRDLLLPILSNSGKVVGEDFYLCFSPERVDPGNVTWNTKNTPKIIGGITNKCINEGRKFYEKVFDKVIEVSAPEVAELVKVFENTFRMINIALVNELSQICDHLNVDVWEVIDAASTKPFGFMKFTPGPGLGGHCIPLDPHYLSWKMRSLSIKTKMIDIASEINSGMPTYVVAKISEKLNSVSKSLKESKILLIGVAYKKDIDDLRESPALEIMNLLYKASSTVFYHDPYCPQIKFGKGIYSDENDMYSVELTKDKLIEADIVVVTTDHTNIDYKLIIENSKLIVDTRGVLREFYL